MEYYDEKGNYRNRFDFEREKEKYNKILNEWVGNLPKKER